MSQTKSDLAQLMACVNMEDSAADAKTVVDLVCVNMENSAANA